MDIGTKIKNARIARGMTQEELGEMLGLQKSAIAKYENGRVVNIKRSTLKKISDVLGIPPHELIFEENAEKPNADISFIDNILPLPKHKKLPMLGTIACGEPIFAEENIDGYISCPENIDADFCLRCKGDSMIGARIQDGDIVYIRQQPDVENGEIAAVLIDNEATLKRVYKKNESIILQPENPAYEPLIFVREEMNNIRILGKAVCFLSRVK